MARLDSLLEEGKQGMIVDFRGGVFAVIKRTPGHGFSLEFQAPADGDSVAITRYTIDAKGESQGESKKKYKSGWEKPEPEPDLPIMGILNHIETHLRNSEGDT